MEITLLAEMYQCCGLLRWPAVGSGESEATPVSPSSSHSVWPFFFTFFFVPPGWMLSSFDVMMTLPPSEGFSHRLSPGPSRETAVVLELLPHCGSVIVLYICNGAVRYVESEPMACDFAENQQYRCAAEPSGPLACACSCSLSLPSALTRLFVLVWGYIITGVLPRSCAEPAIVTRTVLIL